MRERGKRQVHLWAPELTSFGGGIQRYSLSLAEALGAAPSVHLSLTAAKHDRQAWRRGDIVCGTWPASTRTAAFASRLTWRTFWDRPDLIVMSHANFSRLALVLKKLTGVRYACVAHGVEVWGEAGRALAPGLRAADHVFAISRHTRGRLQADAGVSSGRISLLPDTFDEDRFRPGRKDEALLRSHGLPEDAKVVFSLGRLAAAEAYKGFDRVIHALPTVAKAVPDVRYVIGGRGDDQARLRRLATEVGVADRVVFAGFLADEELPAWYRSCDVFAMPSTGEGFGIVFLEAAGCGKPSLAGDLDGSPDALLDGQLGRLVNPKSVEAISAALIDLLQADYRDGQIAPHRLAATARAAFGAEAFRARVSSAISRLIPD